MTEKKSFLCSYQYCEHQEKNLFLLHAHATSKWKCFIQLYSIIQSHRKNENSTSKTVAFHFLPCNLVNPLLFLFKRTLESFHWQMLYGCNRATKRSSKMKIITKRLHLLNYIHWEGFGRLAGVTMFGGIFSNHLVTSLELWGRPSVCNNVKPAKDYPSFSHRTSDKITLIFLAAL